MGKFGLLLITVLALVPIHAWGDDCTTQGECYANCNPSGNPGNAQQCLNICASYPVSCDNPNEVTYRIWRPGNGTWYTLLSTGATEVEQWGLAGDAPRYGRYAHLFSEPNETDPALLTVWRPSTGNWHACYFSQPDCANSGNTPVQFGLPGDYPLIADFDGDAHHDITVWRPSSGDWHYVESSDGEYHTRQWGLPGDYPIVGRFDGDALGDHGVWRNSNGYWYILRSTNWYSRDFADALIVQWGLPGDHPIPGDFDGDDLDDLVVWRPVNGMWYVCQSSTGYNCAAGLAVQFGLPGDMPLSRDFDGDGKNDYAVWRQSAGQWYHKNSSTGAVQTQQWGLFGDIPDNVGIRDLASKLYGG